MQTVKKILLLIFVVLFLFSMAISSSAHSGRTDSSGGHYNRSTGEYHYHCGGHPAHQHHGDGCPFDSTLRVFILIAGLAGYIALAVVAYNKFVSDDSERFVPYILAVIALFIVALILLNWFTMYVY